MRNYVQEYSIDLSKYPGGITEDRFNYEVDFAIDHFSDLIPHDSENYTEKVIKLAIRWADDIFDPNSEFNRLASIYDKYEPKEEED